MTIRVENITSYNRLQNVMNRTKLPQIGRPIKHYIPISDYIGPVYEDKFVSSRKLK